MHESAMKLKIPTLLPHFIEDSAKLRRLCKLDMYAFPAPRLLSMEASETLKYLFEQGKAQGVFLAILSSMNI